VFCRIAADAGVNAAADADADAGIECDSIIACPVQQWIESEKSMGMRVAHRPVHKRPDEHHPSHPRTWTAWRFLACRYFLRHGQGALPFLLASLWRVQVLGPGPGGVQMVSL
jgi:hypothetical protein